MQTTDTIAAIEQILGGGHKLYPAPPRFDDDLVSSVMPVREVQPLRYALRDGQLAGLNLAGAGLSDAQWAKIRNLEGFEPGRIEALNLRGNRLSGSPVAGMSNLRYLDLSDNQLRELSLSAGATDRLTHIWLYGNKALSDPPPEIVSRGKDAILNYLREQAREETVCLREAKLLILGESGAGKTSLALKMKNVRHPLPKKDDSTRGISVDTLPIGAGENAFDIHIWDFGGQQIYHGTHRFFLTKRSLYIVLADNRKQDTDFDYWLQMAELYGEGSPLYIVVNQSDNRPPYPNIGGMKARFEFLKDQLAANLDTLAEYDRSEGAAARNTAATQKVTDTLKSRICELEHVGQPLPRSWYDIRRELERVREQENRSFISLERYYDICAARGIEERERQLFLSTYLHDLGAILHFQDDAALRETVILRMMWATDAVFKAYDSPLVNSGDRPGFFQKKDIHRIWADNEYIDKREQLLALMLRFKLCYRVGESEEYIMPELLPFAQPDYAAHIPELNADDLKNAPAVRYSYDFMPRGIFARFAVEVHRLIAHGQQFIWREGAILQSGNSYALVTETYGNREIVVRCTGKRRRELMSIATHHLDNIHASFPKLRVNKLVPCNCAACQKLDKPHYYDFEDLKSFLENGRKEVICNKYPYAHLSVQHLLDEIFSEEGKLMPPEPILDKQRVIALIKAGETRKALEALEGFFPDAVLLLAQLAKADKAYNVSRIITGADHDATCARINNAMLEWLNRRTE